MARRVSILVCLFVIGAYALCAQATLLREAQVILFGSELAWGLVLGFWLAGVALGAQAGGWLARRPWPVLTGAGLAMPLVLVLAVALARLARMMLGVGPGEYVGPGQMALVSLAATLPVSLWVGLSFPAASALAAEEARTPAARARAVGWAYLVESGGSLAGGVLYSFVLVERVDAVTLALAGGAILAGAISAAAHAFGRIREAVLLPVGCAALAALFVVSGRAARFNDATVGLRWQSFASGLDLLRSEDSRYHNLALGRLESQFSLYVNGLVAATWPNHTDLAVEAHLAACEAPSPRRILVLGGGAEGMLKELLRHKPERLDYVTLDPRLLALITAHLDEPDRRALLDEAVRVHFADIRRFVNRSVASGEERYGLILLAAPEPASTLEARLYTAEFFAELAALLADDGVLAFALRGSVGHWDPAPAEYVGSIVRPLEQAFPEVVLTFGYPTRVFAARRAGVLAGSGEELSRRYEARGVESPHFHPLWFKGASDLLDAAKREQLASSLARHPPAMLNADDRPAAALYHMRFWLQASESRWPDAGAPAPRADVLGAVLCLRLEWVLAAAGAAAALAAAAGAVRGRAAFGRAAALWSLATTGLATMALEVALLYSFQTLYGYVYGMVGLIVGVFMFGLMAGSFAMNRLLRRDEAPAAPGAPAPGSEHAFTRGLRRVAVLDVTVILFAVALVPVLTALRSSASDWAVQAATFGLVAAAGVLGGLIFPLAASILLVDRPSAARAAGTVDAADCAGACIGALATGVLLVPVLGVTGACLAVAGTKAASALWTGAAAMMRPGRGPEAGAETGAPTSPGA
ncbi:MAG: hypothetical protein FJ288_15600 [Planctomycetes bacterium]|nr:hypothetical protein [Planctomycetota bacterium]